MAWAEGLGKSDPISSSCKALGSSSVDGPALHQRLQCPNNRLAEKRLVILKLPRNRAPNACECNFRHSALEAFLNHIDNRAGLAASIKAVSSPKILVSSPRGQLSLHEQRK